MKCCQSFTLSEISDVAWGLLRMYIETNQSSSNHSSVNFDQDSSSLSEISLSEEGIKTNFLSDSRMFAILQQIEVLVTTNSSSLKRLRP